MRAVDVFYVKDVFGLKVENERKLSTLRDALLGALYRHRAKWKRPWCRRREGHGGRMRLRRGRVSLRAGLCPGPAGA